MQIFCIFRGLETKTILLIILLAIGALQGIIYGIILCNSKTIHRTAHRFLAAILFFFSYRLIVEFLHFFGIGRYDTWYYLFLEYNWVYGALIYFFTLSYFNPQFKLKNQHWVHFIPVGIEIIWSFFIKSQNFYWDGTKESLSTLGYWGYIIWMHHPTMYVISGILIFIYAFKSLQICKQPPKVVGYKILKEHTIWIRRVVIALLIFSIIFTFTTLIDYFFFDYAFNFFGYPIFIIMAIITYWLGLEGFSRRHQVAFKSIEIPSEKEVVQLTAIATKIQQVMQEEQLFKNPELTVGILSESIATKPYLVTKAFTQIIQKKFSDYTNELRFNELNLLLKDPVNEKFTLLSLAFEAGFNSKASFNRTVKRITGKSPKHLKSEQ